MSGDAAPQEPQDEPPILSSEDPAFRCEVFVFLRRPRLFHTPLSVAHPERRLVFPVATAIDWLRKHVFCRSCPLQHVDCALLPILIQPPRAPVPKRAWNEVSASPEPLPASRHDALREL